MLKCLFGFVLISFLTASALAGEDWYEKGNGGFVLLCPGKSAQVFDLYEATARYDFTMDLSARQSLDERVAYLISKFDSINPTRAILYRQWYAEFMSEARFIEHATINPLADIGFGYVPKDCHLEQAAYQRAPSIVNGFRYVLNKDLWEGLDISNKAALVMHEIIYRELTQAPNIHENSESTRYFNGLLNSQEFTKIPVGRYLETLQALRIMSADYGPVRVLLGAKHLDGAWGTYPVVYAKDGSLLRLRMDNIQNFKIGKLTMDSRCVAAANNDLGSSAEFSANGKINFLSIIPSMPDSCVLPKYHFTNQETSFVLQGNRWTFDDNGNVRNVENDIDLTDLDMKFDWQGYHFVLERKTQGHVGYIFEFSSEQEIETFGFLGQGCFAPKTQTVKFVAMSGASGMKVFEKDSLKAKILKLPICD